MVVDMENGRATKNRELRQEVEELLRGKVAAGEMAYVGAELAYVLGALEGRYVANETEFIDFLGQLDCSYELKSDLMKDVRPFRADLAHMQGKYGWQACVEMVQEAAWRSGPHAVQVPPSLVPVVTRILSSGPGGRMADLACGHGVVLGRALDEDADLQGDGIDIQIREANFAEMALEAWRPRGRVLRESVFPFLTDNMWKYDKVFCFPPFGSRSDRGNLLEAFNRMLPGVFPGGGAGCRSELLFALAAVAAMKGTGRAAVLLPAGALSAQLRGCIAAREFLLNGGCLDCVVSLPERMLERTGVRLALLVFAGTERRDTVRMVDASGLGSRGRRFTVFGAEDADRIVDAVYGFRREDGWTEAHCRDVPCKELRENGCDFSVERHFRSPAVLSGTPCIRFGEVLLRVERGTALTSAELDARSVADGGGRCHYLSPGRIDGGMLPDSLPELDRLPEGAVPLEAGDILFVRTGTCPKTAIYEGNFGKPVVASGNFFICRPDPRRIDPWYLLAFFGSDPGREMLETATVGTMIKAISRKSLENLLVPCPPLEDQQRVAGIFREAFERFRRAGREREDAAREMAGAFGRGRSGT